MLREHPQLRENPLAGSDEGRPIAQGFVPVNSCHKPIWVVGDQVVEIGVNLHVNVEHLIAGSSDGIPKDDDARQFFPVGSSHLDLGHAIPLSRRSLRSSRVRGV